MMIRCKQTALLRACLKNRNWCSPIVAAIVTTAAAINFNPALQAAPAVATGWKTHLVGEDIVVKFQGGPGNNKDWIGIYPEGETPDGNPPSTRWYYVDGTGAGNTGLTEGSVAFLGGLNLAGDFRVHFLINDGYTALASAAFTVVDPSAAVVRPSKSAYSPGETIELSFSNGPANAKDWIAVYSAGEVPDGNPPALLWFYVDGTKNGAAGRAEGKVSFNGGLNQTGEFAAFFLLNDGYDVLAREPFLVAPPAGNKPRVLSVTPGNAAQKVLPRIEFQASVTNGASKVIPSSVKLDLDGNTVAHQYSDQTGLVTIAYLDLSRLFSSESSHTFKLSFTDNAAPPNLFAITNTFSVAKYQDLALPEPIYFENFDAVPEGQLPSGWREQNYTEKLNEDLDFGNLDSAAYVSWTVINADRFKGSFVTYSNPGNPDDWETDYQRVLTPNPFNVVGGRLFEGTLARGRFLFSNSGYRNGSAQVMYLFTPEFNLTGRQNVHLAFNSLWEQNQDSIAAAEYSIDGGQNWLPVAYFIDAADLKLDAQNNVDAVATLTTEYGDVARYVDPQNGESVGGTYGAFIASLLAPELGPYIQGRANDDRAESKRIELYRLPVADNQAKVRFRFAHAGTDSWYWGIDDFGLYSISTTIPRPTLSVSRSGSQITVAWAANAPAFVLERANTVSPAAWSMVPGVTGNSALIEAVGNSQYFRLRAP